MYFLSSVKNVNFLIILNQSNIMLSSHNYLSSEAEASFGLHHLLHNMALDTSSIDVFIDHTVLQMDIIYRQTDQRQLIGEGEEAKSVICGPSGCQYTHLHAIGLNSV